MSQGDFPIDSHAIQVITKNCEIEKYPIYFMKLTIILYQYLTKRAEKKIIDQFNL